MDYQKERQLLEKYKLGQATEQEKAIVEDWISYGLFPEHSITEQELEKELSAIDKQLPLVTKTTKLWPGFAGAAAILLILGAGLFYYANKSAQVLPQTTAYYDDVNPGSFGATLTLSDGKHIRLADAANGELSNEAGILITKSADGKLIYKVKSNGAGANKHNTLSTAKGETYQVNLPDGSAVWLNAASSLTYSTSIHYDGVRRVELQGEAYFEIAKDKKRPFVVKTAKQEVKVLGTQFNVSSYTEEPLTATTLLEGSVLVTANSGAVDQKIIKPGEQAVLSAGGLKISAVDTQEAVAWKNGKFIFQEEAIGSIMRKIARWYDVEVVYQVDLKDMTFSGSMSRFENISQVLRKIEMTDLVHFKVEGRRIVVIK